MTPAAFGADLELAERAARAAAELLMDYYGRPPEGLGSKSSATDLVSDADREAERVVREDHPPPAQSPRRLYPKKPRLMIVEATSSGTIASQLSSPAAMRRSTSRLRIGRYSGR